MSDITARDVVLAAINAAGPATNHAAWKHRINELIPEIAAMLGERSRQHRIAQRMLDAVPFRALFGGMEIEETSTRGLVTLLTEPSKRYPDGKEPIRTDRGDTAAGKDMIERLSKLEIGTPIFAWKALEEAGDHEVRILAHFEVLGKPEHTTRSQRGPLPATPAGDADSPPPSVSVPNVAEADPQLASLHEAINALSARDKAELARQARQAGITNIMQPGDRFLDLLDIVSSVSAGEHYGDPF